MVLSQRTAHQHAVTTGGASQPAFELNLLGGFSLRRAGLPVEPPLTAQRLLALLALHDGRISRSLIAGTLWLNSTEEKAIGSLRSALWRLRQCAPDVIVAEGSTLALHSAVSVDAKQLMEHGLDLIDGSEPLTTDGLNELIYSNELLPDWYEDWVLVERESLRQLRLSALETAAEQLLDQGNYASAVRAAGAAVRDEPLRESAHRIVIATHIASGNYSDALRQYGVYRKLLHDELQLEPSPHMERLIKGLTSR